MNSTALAYGCGATDRSIHNQLSKCRQLAEQLKDEVKKSGLNKPPRGTESDIGTTPKTPRTSRVSEKGSVTKTGGSSRAPRSGSAAKRGKNLTTPTKAGKGVVNPTAGLSLMDAIAVDSQDEEDGAMSPAKSETISIQDFVIKKEESKEEIKPKVDLFGQRDAPLRLGSQGSGYTLNQPTQVAAIPANAVDEFSIDEIFDAIH